MSFADRITALFSRGAPAPTPAELAADVAPPAADPFGAVDEMPTGQVRRARDELVPVELTPAAAIKALRAARDLTDVGLFVATATEALRRDANLRSLLQTRALAVASLPLVAEAGGPRLQDRKAAEAVQAQLQSEALEPALPHLLLSGAYLGFGAAQLYWSTDAMPWAVSDVQPLPSHWFVFDRQDGREPFMLPAVAGETPKPLPPGKFLFHAPQLLAGNPLVSGIAYTALFYYALKSVALKDWVGFVELYGQPIRVGKYPAGLGNSPQGKKDLEVLKRALRDLGGDAWAMLPESMQIEFVEAATRNASAEVYERLCRFLDEQLAKLVLGGSLTSGTGNTGSGGSQALGTVHNELRADIMRADAKALAATLRRHLARPYVQFNHGDGVAVPRVRFVIEEAEDLTALADSLAKLVPLGLQVSQAEVRDRFGLRAPEAGEAMLGAAAAPADQASQAALSAAFSAAAHDELDDLEAATHADPDYEVADAAVDAALLAAIEDAQDVEQLKAALLAFARDGDTDALRDALTAPLTAARAAGDLGVDVGGE